MLLAPPPPGMTEYAPVVCPRCSCELHGATLCEVCGAADFQGDGLWICFSCGEANAPLDERCARCNKLHVLACPACGREGYHRDLACEFCGAPRAFYPIILRLLSQAGRRVVRSKTHVRPVLVALAVIGLAVTSVFGLLGRRIEALIAGAATCSVCAGALVRIRRQVANTHYLS